MLKIGVISPDFAHRSSHIANAPSDSFIFWFEEIEAAFAYLLQGTLDGLYIDICLLDDQSALITRYQRMIEQLHPQLKIDIKEIKEVVKGDGNPGKVHHFPTLEVLFKNGDLNSVYQPIVETNASGHTVHGLECLSRFYFNGHHYPPELIFNYAAEKLKLANYDKVCLMQALTMVPHDKKTLIFINIRLQTLISANFYPWFKDLLKRTHLNPEQIIIEITEQYCNISEQEMSKQGQNLQALGFKIAIDDFGSGISNLSMLEIMKPSYIKVSGKFIQNCHNNPAKQRIIHNVLELARDFSVDAIVESVELVQDWRKVKDLGARLAQGYYFFRPMAKENLLSLLTTSQSS